MTFGMTVGAVCGGMLMKKGRRKSQFVCFAIGIVGVGICIIKNVYAFIVGKLLFGLSVGLISSTCPRFVEEMVPYHLFDFIAPIFNFS